MELKNSKNEDIIMKVKTENGRKYLQTILPGKGLISRIYKKLMKLNRKKRTLKIRKGLEQTFLQTRYTNGQQT